MAPLTSIIICTHNGQRFLEETLQSVLMQKDASLEIVIVEDGSQDSTGSIISRSLASNKTFHVTLLEHKSRQGIARSYQDGLSLAKGDYFKILDQDDTLPNPLTLARQIDVLNSYANVAFVSGRTNYINEESESYATRGYNVNRLLLEKEKTLADIRWGKRGTFQHGTNLVRTTAFKQIGGDVDIPFVIRTLLHPKWQLAYLDEAVLNYRTHDNNATNSAKLRWQLLQKKSELATEMYPGQAIKAQAQIAFWSALEIAKIGYSQITTRR